MRLWRQPTGPGMEVS
uniref:Uncharacterized protein n=1 Tax=Arundo donax TaxID=35708 RepID=A0A0A9F1Z8_ARUDO